MIITVHPYRGSCKVTYSTKGKYVSLIVNGYQEQLTGQPIQTTASQQAFWNSILNIVEADIATKPR